MKKKLLIVDAFCEAGGEEEVAFYLYETFKQDADFETYIAGPKKSPYFDKKKPDMKDFFDLSLKNKFDMKAIYKLRNILKQYSIDVLNVHGYIAGFGARIACIGLDTKVVWTMHVNIADVNSLNKRKRIIRFKIEQIFNRYLTDRIICVAQELKRKISNNKLKTPVDVIYNGIDVKKFSDHDFASKFFHKENDELVLGFISRLSSQKGLEYLLSLAVMLKERNKNFKLLIVGEGELEDYVKNYIINEKLEKVVKVYPFQKDIPYVLSSIDVLVLPSLFEGFPMIILESLCSGTPVIASDVNGVPEIIKNDINGFLVPSKNVDALYNATDKYYHNRELIRSQGEAGKDIVNKYYTKERMIFSYKNIFNSL